MREIKRLELDKNTIIVLWGDHGWHLGDHGMWTKHTNYEQATRIPLIIRAPGVTKENTYCDQTVETVDLYPTLTALANLDRKIPIGTSETKCLSTESLIDFTIFFLKFSFKFCFALSAIIQFLLKLYQLFSTIFCGFLNLIKNPGFKDFIFSNQVLGSIIKPR